MRRAALLLALLAAPAAAQSEDLLECTSTQVTPAFRDKITDGMLGPESPATDALFDHLGEVTEGCAQRHGLSDDKHESYFTYAIGRLSRDALIERLAKAGISAAVIDEAFDFGPGLSNPVITGALAPGESEKLVAALTANGVAVESLPGASWELVGAYLAASSLMWQARAKLR